MIEGSDILNLINPYTPGAGFMPTYMAGRENLLNNADKYLDAIIKGYPQQSVIYFGLRGVGKTVLLNAIEGFADNKSILYEHIEIKERRGTKADKGYFEQQMANVCKKFIHSMSLGNSAKDLVKKAMSALAAFRVTYSTQDNSMSVGLDENFMNYIGTGDLSSDLTDLFVTMGRVAQKTGYAICFFIDEIQYMKEPEIEALVSAVHRCNQLRLPVMMFGAGLPKILKTLGEAKSYTERLFLFEKVGTLSFREACAAIEEPAVDLGVRYTKPALKKIIDITESYPYFIQAFCNIIWDNADTTNIDFKDVEQALAPFWAYMDTGFFMVRFARCTKKEKQFMFAMVKCGDLPCTISNVAKIMNVSVNSISTFRAQLINKGLIYATDYAEIDFTVPQFDGFLKRINPGLSI